MKLNKLLNESRIISPITWSEFSKIVDYILKNEYVQQIIEDDPKFAKQLRSVISKLQQDFDI